MGFALFSRGAGAALVILLQPAVALSQTLTLRESLDTALQNHGAIRAKESRRDAARHDLSHTKQTYLPEVVLSAQQAYGTVNAMHGPLYSPGGPSNASTSAPPLPEQNWNASFGALYSVLVHWNVSTFGRLDRQIELSSRTEDLRRRELELEKFKHGVRVTHAYLNLSTAQRIHHIQKENVSRLQVVLETVESHTGSGLSPGVDASFARAELANARALRLKAHDAELLASKELAVLMGVPFREFQLEPTFYEATPEATEPAHVTPSHPVLAMHEGQVLQGEQEARIGAAEGRPTLFAFGLLQGRGSGFRNDYGQNPTAFSRAYVDGVGIDRGNYVAGLGLSWNLSALVRSFSREAAQEGRTRAFHQEQELATQELVAQARFAEHKFHLAAEVSSETRVQQSAAAEGYQQSKARYDSGLGTIVELTQATFAVTRAEVDLELAQNGLWQALLLKSAASGDLNPFLQQVRGARNQ
ncbi:TolC family protein [Myxococcus landrumensis]|uniref:TolC family protein n=1 Tax=Myxococcus landrumensis TaxID=2813577 RepID=A0ABX7N756_9BACT|nr:TolC family protein [Myxococcus landrumus]QSQ14582.1 TolC family protein [Myxococcus landrumus]